MRIWKKLIKIYDCTDYHSDAFDECGNKDTVIM